VIRTQEYDAFDYNICKIQSYIFILTLHGQGLWNSAQDCQRLAMPICIWEVDT